MIMFISHHMLISTTDPLTHSMVFVFNSCLYSFFSGISHCFASGVHCDFSRQVSYKERRPRPIFLFAALSTSVLPRMHAESLWFTTLTTRWLSLWEICPSSSTSVCASSGSQEGAGISSGSICLSAGEAGDAGFRHKTTFRLEVLMLSRTESQPQFNRLNGSVRFANAFCVGGCSPPLTTRQIQR